MTATVSRLTLGTAQLGMPYGIANTHGQPDPAQTFEILATALALGVRTFDTATAYGDSETRLGEFFRAHGKPADVAIVTKLPALARDQVAPGKLRDEVRRRVDDSCAALGVERLDFYLLHAADDLRFYGADLADALADMRDAGRIGVAGVSVYSPADARVALRFPVFRAIQFPANLFDWRMITTGTLARIKAAGYITFARSAFLQGLFALVPDQLPPALWAARDPLRDLLRLLHPYRLRPMDVALAVLRAVPDIDSLTVGVETQSQLRENVARLEMPLPTGLYRQIRERFSHVPREVIDPSRWKQKAS